MWLSPNDFRMPPSSVCRPTWLPVTSLSPSRTTAWLPRERTELALASFSELWNALITELMLRPDAEVWAPQLVLASSVEAFGPNAPATMLHVLSTIALSRSVTNDWVFAALPGPTKTPTPLRWISLLDMKTFVVGDVDWTDRPALNW